MIIIQYETLQVLGFKALRPGRNKSAGRESGDISGNGGDSLEPRAAGRKRNQGVFIWQKGYVLQSFSDERYEAGSGTDSAGGGGP